MKRCQRTSRQANTNKNIKFCWCKDTHLFRHTQDFGELTPTDGRNTQRKCRHDDSSPMTKHRPCRLQETPTSAHRRADEAHPLPLCRFPPWWLPTPDFFYFFRFGVFLSVCAISHTLDRPPRTPHICPTIDFLPSALRLIHLAGKNALKRLVWILSK